MRSESTALRDASPGLCFTETSMRPLCVSFHPADIAADLAAAARKVTRLHDLPDPAPPVPVVLRIPVE
jgi:hypothetical protein